MWFVACAGEVQLDSKGELGHDGSADAGTETGQAGESGETADSEEPTGPASVSGLRASVHPQMGSIIELSWTQTGNASIHADYAVSGEPAMQTPVYELGSGEHRLLLLGAPFDVELHWTLYADGAAVEPEALIQTDPPPGDLPRADLITADEAAWDPELRWLVFPLAPRGWGGPDHPWTVMVDRQGRPVWAWESPTDRTTFASQIAFDGRAVLVDYNSWWGAYDGGVNSQVAAVDIEGDEIERFDTPGLIHPFTQLGDGSLVWGASLGSSYDGERLDILEPGGEPRTLWDCNDYARDHGESACGSNALHWDEARQTILFSL